jgi:hypothetical protein
MAVCRTRAASVARYAGDAVTFTSQALSELQWARVTPPKRNGGKTTCPHCSHTRVKSTEPCLRVIEQNDALHFSCYHCGWDHTEYLAIDSYAL